jgi:hypothetical protein
LPFSSHCEMRGQKAWLKNHEHAQEPVSSLRHA